MRQSSTLVTETVRKRKKFRLPLLFSLRPYGNNLISNQTRRWTICIGIVIFFIAIVEGSVWGKVFDFYFESTISQNIRTVISIAVGIMIFLLIWIIDSSFVTLDLSKSPIEENRKWYQPSSNDVKNWSSIIFRILLVALSLYVTVPGIVRLSIADDVRKTINEDNEKQIAGLINKTNDYYTGQIYQKDSLLSVRRDELTKEIAGQGRSKHYGDKIVAASIRTEINALEKQISKLQADKLQKVQEIANSPYDTLTRKYGIVFIATTPGQIEKVAEKLQKEENNRAVEKISRVYVIFAFIALLLLKLLSPRSVNIYYNEDMQNLYISVQNNQINQEYLAYLKDLTGDTNHYNVTPHIFEDFWKSYRIRRNKDTEMASNDVRLGSLEEKMSKLNHERSKVMNDISVAQAAFDICFEKISELTKELNEKGNEGKNFESKIANLTEKMNIMKATDSRSIAPEDFVAFSTKKKDLQENLFDAQYDLRKIEADISDVKSRIEQNELRMEAHKDELEMLRDTIQTINEMKQDLREDYVSGFEIPKMKIA